MSGAQSVYSPLPQSLTDSESEEELHNSISHNRNNSRKYYPNNVNPNRNDKPVTNGTDPHNYHPLDDIDNGFPNIRMDLDNVSILNSKKEKPMSPMRKFSFITSILICIFTIIIFLWVLPCSGDGTCPASTPLTKTPSWIKTYSGLELKGVIGVVDGITGKNKNLVFLYRGDVIHQNHTQMYKEGGIISLLASSGKVAWYHEMNKIPIDLDCTLMDVDKNGFPDCIVLGNNGQLEAMNPVSGIVYWSLDTSSANISSLEFPLIIMDLDNDGVYELLTSSSINHEDNYIMIISGGRGKIMGDPFKVANCTSVHKLSINNDNLNITFICRSNSTESPKTIPLSDLYTKITNKTFIKNKLARELKQHQRFGQQKETENQTSIYVVNGRQLIVENHGRCPKCSVSVQLVDQRFGINNVTWDYTGGSVYGMVPASLSFNKNKKSFISGFVLKFWQWNTALNKSGETKRSVNPRNDQLFDFPHIKSVWELPLRQKRNVNNEDFKYDIDVHNLTERVVLITFNATDMHIVNASQSDVTQLCINTDKETVCQPDLGFQENSLMIADLDEDGSQELVSYLSSYDSFGEGVNFEWKLKTSVRVVRLEAQLPKLYEAMTKH